jgi:hypothetical protein
MKCFVLVRVCVGGRKVQARRHGVPGLADHPGRVAPPARPRGSCILLGVRRGAVLHAVQRGMWAGEGWKGCLR